MPTKIEWATETWNPITGCSPISEGCAHCYAQRMAKRLAGRFGYPEDEPFRVTFHEDRLMSPSSWKKPQRVFACSMGDLFHEDVPQEWIEEVFATIAENPQHTFIVLTKRPERMCKILNDEGDSYFWAMVEGICQKRHHERTGEDPSLWLAVHGPLPNVIGMVTAENQHWLDYRVPWLLKTELAYRGVSLEPMLGEVDLNPYFDPTGYMSCGGIPECECPGCIAVRNWPYDEHGMVSLDWVIAGGETGPGARPLHPDWTRKVRDDCQAAGVPFFFKQWGMYRELTEGERLHDGDVQITPTGEYSTCGSCWKGTVWCNPPLGTVGMKKTTKKAAGHILDGREWRELPGVRP